MKTKIYRDGNRFENGGDSVTVTTIHNVLAALDRAATLPAAATKASPPSDEAPSSSGASPEPAPSASVAGSGSDGEFEIRDPDVEADDFRWPDHNFALVCPDSGQATIVLDVDTDNAEAARQIRAFLSAIKAVAAR